MEINQDQNIEECFKCDKVFNSKDLFIKHFKNTHCSFCDFNKTKKVTISDHTKDNHKEAMKLVIYNGAKSENDKRIKPFQCQHCNKSYKLEGFLKRHTSNVHSEQPMVKLELSEDFQPIVYNNDDEFRCEKNEECKNLVFDTKFQRDTHNFMRHEGVYKCKEEKNNVNCPAMLFNSVFELKSHYYMRHDKDPRFKCRKCGNMWVSFSVYHKHIKNVQEKGHDCKKYMTEKNPFEKKKESFFGAAVKTLKAQKKAKEVKDNWRNHVH